MGWFDFGSSSDTSSSGPDVFAIKNEIFNSIQVYWDPIAEIRDSFPKISRTEPRERWELNNLLGWGFREIGHWLPYPEAKGWSDDLKERRSRLKTLMGELSLSDEQKTVLNRRNC